MIKRNWILATFLLLVLISLGCTSAAEDIQSDANMAVDDNINNEISVVENNELEDNNPIADEQLGETNNVGTFTDLDNKIQNAEYNLVELDRDYAFDDTIDNPQYYSKIGGIYLYNNLIIDGKGHTIDGNNQAKIFVIQDMFNITIKNLIFKNAYANSTYDRGAALEIENAPAHVINCTFINNFANNTSGGAIFDYGHSTIENCTFLNNYGGQGGAIYGNPNINNCTFINNSAYYGGGALLLTRHCYLNNSAFYNNTAIEGGGGAISGSALKFENSIFEGNKAANNGGAMSLSDNWYTLEINNCTFKSNVANLNGKQESYNGGGAVYMGDNKGLVTNSKFINNTGNNGGALLSWTSVAVKNTTFEENNGKMGGAIYMGVGAVTDCTFTNNNASLTGGAIHGGSWNFTVSYSTFEKNNAADGGAMYIIKGNISNSQFFNNSATSSGGAAFLNNSDVYNCQFAFNNASDGGAVYMANTTVNESQFYNNTAVNGAALYVTEGAVFNSEFADNVAELSGGAVSVVNSLNLTNVEFYHNIADGVISNFDPGAPVRITVDSVLTAADASYVINYGGDYSVYLKDFDGYPILGSALSFVFNGVELGNVTMDDTGLAKITLTPDILKAATAGTRNLVISYAGDGYFNPVTKTVAITVKKEPLNVVAKAASYVINYGGYYSVTVKDSKNNLFIGKTMTFFLNGKNIGTAKTNANGVARIKLTASILKAAKYGTKNFVIKFDDSFYTASKTVKVTIKKEKTKITAKKKTFKIALKTKKYTIALKNSKGKAIKKAKVFLKVKGKTYKATTNSKGKATFKIKNLKKRGTFTAKITYKTTAYYLKTSKKVYLKVK